MLVISIELGGARGRPKRHPIDAVLPSWSGLDQNEVAGGERDAVENVAVLERVGEIDVGRGRRAHARALAGVEHRRVEMALGDELVGVGK
jgi:hypothetical protein